MSLCGFSLRLFCRRFVVNGSMFEVHVVGFKTEEQARQFIEWYEGQGEQDITIWLECRQSEGLIDISTMNTRCEATYPLIPENNVFTLVVEPE